MHARRKLTTRSMMPSKSSFSRLAATTVTDEIKQTSLSEALENGHKSYNVITRHQSSFWTHNIYSNLVTFPDLVHLAPGDKTRFESFSESGILLKSDSVLKN
jgi:hypothetical protein